MNGYVSTVLFVLSQFCHFFVRTLINEWALPVSLDQRLINEGVWLGVVLRNFSVLQFGIQTHPGGRVVRAEIFFCLNSNSMVIT